MSLPNYYLIPSKPKNQKYPVYDYKFEDEISQIRKVQEIMEKYMTFGLVRGDINFQAWNLFKEQCEVSLHKAGISVDAIRFIQLQMENSSGDPEWICSMCTNNIFPEVSKVAEISASEEALKKGLAYKDNLAVQERDLLAQLKELNNAGANDEIRALWIQKIKNLRAQSDFLRHETVLINLFNAVELSYINNGVADYFNKDNY